MTRTIADQLGVWKLPPNLRSCFNARGLYDPLRFVVRLRPDIHRRLEGVESGVRSPRELSDEFLFDYSTYFHETVHWSQHIGSTSGLLLSFMYPAQMHLNRRSLAEFTQVPYNVKPLAKLAEIWAHMKANGSPPDRLNPQLNRILNNWHDMESFRWLLTNPNKASEVSDDEYFFSSGHCFRIGVGSFLWLLAATFDPDQTCVPDPRPWEPEFEQLAKAGTVGFVKGTTLPQPPLGALEIFEGQARFSQMQFLRQSTRKYRTWDDFEKAGMFRDVYTSAFKFFCTALQETIPSDPTDPLVAMFLLVCDLAMNPAEFLLLPAKPIQEIERTIHPGHRFVAACETLKRLGPSFYKSITGFTKAEYEVGVARLCAENGWASPLDIAEEMARWSATQPSIAQIREEAQSLTFQPMNMPVRLFFGKFLLYHEMKRTHPEVLCWPGFWAAGNDRVDSLTPLFEELYPVFIDTAEGEVKARAIEGKSSAALAQLMNNFFSWISLYDLTRQWIMVDADFDFDLTWLTLQYSSEDQERFSSSIFKNVHGIEPRSIIPL
jgi:hypothetical protein